jgi:site-specific recombinase XerD
MAVELSGELAALYGEFLESEKPKVSEQGYIALKDYTARFLRVLDEQELNVCEMGVVEAVHVGAVLSQMVTREGKPIARGTVKNYFKVARRFFDFLIRSERRKTNSFREVEYPRMGERISKNVLTEAQMGRLLTELARFDEPSDFHRRRKRYKAHVVAEFLYSTGLRIAEAASLFPSDLDLQRRLVYLKEGKGARPRTAFLTGYAAEVMKYYLEKGRSVVAQELKNRGDSETLFCSFWSSLDASLNTELSQTCQALELPVITSHCFRHSLGTHLLRSGCDMRYIQAILGHERLATTQIYTRVEKEDLKRVLDDFHPRQYGKGKDNRE